MKSFLVSVFFVLFTGAINVEGNVLRGAEGTSVKGGGWPYHAQGLDVDNQGDDGDHHVRDSDKGSRQGQGLDLGSARGQGYDNTVHGLEFSGDIGHVQKSKHKTNSDVESKADGAGDSKSKINKEGDNQFEIEPCEKVSKYVRESDRKTKADTDVTKSKTESDKTNPDVKSDRGLKPDKVDDIETKEGKKSTRKSKMEEARKSDDGNDDTNDIGVEANRKGGVTSKNEGRSDTSLYSVMGVDGDEKAKEIGRVKRDSSEKHCVKKREKPKKKKCKNVDKDSDTDDDDTDKDDQDKDDDDTDKDDENKDDDDNDKDDKLKRGTDENNKNKDEVDKNKDGDNNDEADDKDEHGKGKNDKTHKDKDKTDGGKREDRVPDSFGRRPTRKHGKGRTTRRKHCRTTTVPDVEPDLEGTFEARGRKPTSGPKRVRGGITPLNKRTTRCPNGAFYRSGCEVCYCLEHPSIPESLPPLVQCDTLFAKEEECQYWAPQMHCSEKNLHYGFNPICEGSCTCDPDRLVTVCARLPCNNQVLTAAGYYRQSRPRPRLPGRMIDPGDSLEGSFRGRPCGYGEGIGAGFEAPIGPKIPGYGWPNQPTAAVGVPGPPSGGYSSRTYMPGVAGTPPGPVAGGPPAGYAYPMTARG